MSEHEELQGVQMAGAAMMVVILTIACLVAVLLPAPSLAPHINVLGCYQGDRTPKVALLPDGLHLPGGRLNASVGQIGLHKKGYYLRLEAAMQISSPATPIRRQIKVQPNDGFGHDVVIAVHSGRLYLELPDRFDQPVSLPQHDCRG